MVKWLNSSIGSIDGTLTGITTRDQSGPESNDHEGILHMPQNSRTEASPSDSLVSYPGQSFGVCGGVSYTSAEMRLVYSTTSADWVEFSTSSKVTGHSVRIKIISMYKLLALRILT